MIPPIIWIQFFIFKNLILQTGVFYSALVPYLLQQDGAEKDSLRGLPFHSAPIRKIKFLNYYRAENGIGGFYFGGNTRLTTRDFMNLSL